MTNRLPVPRLFIIGALLIIAIAALTGMLSGSSTLDIHLHDTYFVIAHAHVILLIAAIFIVFAGIYYCYPRVFKRRMNRLLGHIHFFISFGCILFIIMPVRHDGIAGAPRRYYDYSAWESFKQFSSLNELATGTTLLLLIGQALFVCNFVGSLFVKRKI